MKALILAVIVIGLVGCDAQEKRTSEVKAPVEKPVVEETKKGVNVCVGLCMGPRINLSTGELEIGPSLNMGPSLMLFP